MKVMEDVVVKANKSVDLFRLTVHPECFAQVCEVTFLGFKRKDVDGGEFV